jgi:hypothetical protein
MKARLPDTPRTLTALATVVLLLAGLAVTLAVRDARDAGSPANLAFVDQRETDAVIQDTERIVTRVFSIDPLRVRATRRAAAQTLVGDAVAAYARLYRPFLARARKDGLGLSTATRAIGVVELAEDRGRLLVLADQSATSPDGQSTTGAARFELGVVRRDGVWKVDRIEVL